MQPEKTSEGAMKSYVAVVHRREAGFAISFPDLPGCRSTGATMEAARAEAEHALAVHLQHLVEAGDAIPVPSSLKEIVADPKLPAANIDTIILAVRPVVRTAHRAA